MIQIVVLYLVTVFVFLALDAVMLKQVLSPFFEKHIPELLADTINLPAAVLFIFSTSEG